MCQRGLRAIQPKNYLPKTSDGRANRPCANLLAQQLLPDRPGRTEAARRIALPQLVQRLDNLQHGGGVFRRGIWLQQNNDSAWQGFQDKMPG